MQLTSLQDITRKYRHIFLAPHFDDVVFACGGTLGVQVSSGLRPLVITVFGGVPPTNMTLPHYALQTHQEMGFSDSQGPSAPMEARRREDAAAADYLEVDYLWLDYLDASYRGNYSSIEAIMGGEVHPSDQNIEKQLSQDLLNIKDQLPDVVWYAPLGAGRHVDHQIVSSAADHLVQQGSKVYYYEDFPYVFRQKGALDARLQEIGANLEPHLVEVSEFLPARVTASEMYASQIARNFPGKDAIQTAMHSYTHNIRPIETVCLERYWKAR
ncbi:MAG TPA: PIG-L family deacetylase [Ktedonobacteraceae bacterium]|nr:PIG-L family deacetylase [Ktedonobacteraceae bacterium]